MKRKDLTQGPIFKTLFLYSLPIVITNVIQLLFHAVDVAVLSVMTGDAAVAAVGSCGSIINLLVSLFTGFSTGSSVLVARRVGAGDGEKVRRAVGTSLLIGAISGIALMLTGVIFARQMLILTNCQPDVLDQAAVYMRIYFLGMPVIMLYNFAASVLRASGDSLRPTVFITVSGVLNAVMNVIFVGVLHLAVDGVAWATVLSKVVALVLILTTLSQKGHICRIEKKNLRLGKEESMEIVRIGIPTCLGSMFFYVANVIVSAAVNSLSTNAMTANAISGQFDSVIYTVGSAIAIAASTMVGQNFGARRADRVRKTVWVSVGYVTAVSFFLGAAFVTLADPMLEIMTDSREVIGIAKERMTLLCLTYFTTAIMECLAFSLRALRRQKATMVVGAICGFGIRSLWTFFIWPMKRSLGMLFVCYPVSALAAIAIYLVVYRVAARQMETEFSSPATA